jgi:AraC-like DNA-binding protein
MQNLQFLIDALTRDRGLHISIVDVSGILNAPSRKIAFKNVIHSKPFCDVAKSTEKGYRVCLLCKSLANGKAISTQRAFCGHCLYGLCEAAVPLVIGESVAAVVYVGNAVVDEEYAKDRIERTCRHTGVDKQKLYGALAKCEHRYSEEELLGLGEIVCDYIKMLVEKHPTRSTRLHWLVSALKEHAEQTFCSNSTLKELSVLYHKNEKYLGRLFKREMGVSFHEYRLLLRLKKAEALLSASSDKTIDIAFECGFNTVSYFNRAFKAHYGMPPSKYAASKKEG